MDCIFNSQRHSQLPLTPKTNNMKQQTAVSWLRKKLEETYDKEGKLPLAYTFSLLNKAEQIEKEQIIEAAKINLWCAIGDGSDQAEQYYNETYKK